MTPTMKQTVQILCGALVAAALAAPSRADETPPAAETNAPPAAAEAPAGPDVETIQLPGGVSLEMVRIPGTNFCMGRFEVTQAQWEAVTGSNPAKFKNPLNPVEHVSCADCEAFCEKLNGLPEAKEAGLMFRLPTSSEWELACRAGSKKRFTRLADGREIVRETLDEVAWYGDSSGGVPHPVGQLKPNAFGLYDILGNLWEWTSTPAESPQGEKRVNRGGSLDDNGWVCQAHFVNKLFPHSRRLNNGFRLCADLPAEP